MPSDKFVARLIRRLFDCVHKPALQHNHAATGAARDDTSASGIGGVRCTDNNSPLLSFGVLSPGAEYAPANHPTELPDFDEASELGGAFSSARMCCSVRAMKRGVGPTSS